MLHLSKRISMRYQLHIHNNGVSKLLYSPFDVIELMSVALMQSILVFFFFFFSKKYVHASLNASMYKEKLFNKRNKKANAQVMKTKT